MSLLRVGFLVAVLSASAHAGSAATAPNAYVSPYRIEFSVPIEELRGVDQQPPRNSFREESSTPFDAWYSNSVRRRFGAWGPAPKQYRPLPNFESIPAEWKRQRVLAVACNMIGLPYQHHHVPDWDPPRGWPWKPVAFGRNSKGLDCSNFTSWIYNYGLGIHLNSAIERQAETKMIAGPGGTGTIEAKVIRDEKGYDDLVSKLKTGDLLYIKRKGSDTVSHVIMWVGEYGHSPNNTPLVIDDTGPDHKDANGTMIPIGVQLRPFTRDSWYYRSFSHAHRIIGQQIQ